MERKKIEVLNSLNQLQEFVIEEYEDHCEVVVLLTKELECVDVPSKVNGKLVTVIGGDCFFGSRNMKSVMLPDSITKLGVQAFAMCNSLKEIDLPDSITEIGRFAFRDCNGLRRIVLPSGLKKLQTGTFSFCYLPDNVEIVLKEGLEEIETRIFPSGGLYLSFTLKLPKSVKKIAPGAFVPGMQIITNLPYDEKWFED